MSQRTLALASLLLLAGSGEALADPYARVSVVGSLGGSSGTTEALGDETAGAMGTGEVEIGGLAKVFGLYLHAQHTTLVSNIALEPDTAIDDSLSAAATFEQTLLVGPTLGGELGPIRLRFSAGPVAIMGNRVEGSLTDIAQGGGRVVYDRALSLGGGGELRLDLTPPLIKPYAAVRYLYTTADQTFISGGAYNSLSNDEQDALRQSLGNRQRVDGVMGLRFSVLPFLQVGVEGTVGLMRSSAAIEDQLWYGGGVGLHFMPN